MKKVLGVLILSVSLACSSVQTVEYKTAYAAVTAVTTAMNVYGDEFRAGKTNADIDAKVKAAYQSFQQAITALADANVAYDEVVKAGATPAQSQAALGVVTAATAAVTKAASEVVTLISSFHG